MRGLPSFDGLAYWNASQGMGPFFMIVGDDSRDRLTTAGNDILNPGFRNASAEFGKLGFGLEYSDPLLHVLNQPDNRLVVIGSLPFAWRNPLGSALKIKVNGNPLGV